MSASTKDNVRISAVSLARAKDRRALMASEFAAAGLDAAFFDAVDARAEPSKIAAFEDRGPWGELHAHDKACSQSHRDALAAFLESDDSYCLMLEDDVYLSSELKNWIADMSWWPQDADVVKVERWIDDKLVVVMGKDETTHLGRKIKPLVSRHSGTAGYLVSRKGAEKIMSYENREFPADHFLFNISISPLARSLRSYQVTPALTVQGNTPDSEATNPVSTRPTQKKKDWRTSLARGWYEIKPIPRFLALLAIGRVELSKIAWQDITQETQQTKATV